MSSTIDPYEDSSSQMRSGRITIPSRPIEAGVYGWGWVDYGGYIASKFSKELTPTELKLYLHDDVVDRRKIKRVQRHFRRPQWLNTTMIYMPVVLGLILAGTIAMSPYLLLLCLVLSAWAIWNRYKITTANFLFFELDRSMEDYKVGRELLRALSHEDLLRDDVYAFFNLKAAAMEFHGTMGELYSDEDSYLD